MAFIVAIILLYGDSKKADRLLENGYDKFGLNKMYPTKDGGREWYLDMGDPKSSENMFVTGTEDITYREEDDSWRISGQVVKINVNTGEDQQPWKNVEMTGYVKVTSILTDEAKEGNRDEEDDNDSDINWLARGGRHSKEVPCEGTSYIGILRADGSVGWLKEIWHTGGYTEEWATDKITDPIVGRWIGWKVVMYNVDGGSAVKLESYIDKDNDNQWTKATELVDDGNWAARDSDGFDDAGCDRPKDHVITDGGQIASFRFDDMVSEFKYLSIREID